ncbi:MAG: chloride channel protein [Anaerolineae bacterium]
MSTTRSAQKRRPGSLLRWLNQEDISESGVIMLTALLVGIGAGLGAVVFRWLIGTMQHLAYDGLGGLLRGISPFYLLIIPTLGGAIYGPLIYRFAREAKGHGVPEVMEAVAMRGGRIRPRVAVIKSLASAICIGTGGSVGREGPIAQIGSALGSTVGQVLKLSDDRVRTLVACGAAGGISATFNAPIGASIFALEIILGRLEVTGFGAVVISAVTADVVAHFFERDVRAFAVPEYTLISPWELVLYTLLGVLAALGAVAFTRLLYAMEDGWDALRMPEYVKPIVGGLLLGTLGLITWKIDGFPRAFGVGYESITDVLFDRLAFQMVIGLFAVKLLATILTLGAGGSGGIFAPSLFMGAMLGSAFGQVAHQLLPQVTAPAGAYALVGMAAFFSGSAHAPVTSILILFELTGDYRIILPLMLATVVSTLVSRALSRESIYTLKLTRRGIRLEQGRDIDVMQGVTVGEAMSTEVDVVPSDMSLGDLADEFIRTHHHGFPVVDGMGDIVGVVSIRDLEQAVSLGGTEGKVVADIATMHDLLIAYPDEPMWKALRRMAPRDVSRLPVVANEKSRRLVGVLRRRDIVRAYERAIARRAQAQHQAEALRLSKLNRARFTQVVIPPGAPSDGQRVSELDLPPECLIVSIHRGRKLLVPHGYTLLEAGDRVTVLADEVCVPAVERQLSGTEGPASSMP